VGGYDGGDRDPVFYYSREHRLSRASPAVRDLNDGKAIRKPGLFRSLTATRGHLFLLLSIFVICGMILILFHAPRGGELVLGGNRLSLSIREEEEGRVLTITKELSREGEPYTGAVDLAVSPVPPKTKNAAAGEETGAPPEPGILTRRIFFTFAETERYRIPLSFGAGDSRTGKEYYVILRSEEEQKSRKVTLLPEGKP
jgi:hypothetical protein